VDNSEQPVWARSDAFALAPPGWGWADSQGREHPLDSREQLLKVVGGDMDGRVMLVWSPEFGRMVLPEELKGAGAAVDKARTLRLESRWSDSCRRLGWFSVAWAGLAFSILWQAWSALPSSMEGMWRLAEALQLVRRSNGLGLGLLGWLVLGFIPWYQSRKALHGWRRQPAGGSLSLIPALRFDTWLQLQKAPVTRCLAGLVLLVWGMQWWVGPAAIPTAGLVKPAYFAGEWWRLFTAPWLHGNLVHMALNLLALLYLGKRVELFARWPHLLVVLLFASLAGGILSAYQLEASSVGISGGLMGWLGFLLVFESLHRPLVPRSARRRLLAGVFLTALIGALGYRFIDNAAHLGGLLAGMAYGWIVFPRSSSIHRPRVLGIDRLAGAGAGLLLVCGVALTVLRIWGR